MIFSPFAFQNYSVGVSLDADAAAYLAKISSVGGTVNATITSAVNTLFVSLKSNSLYDQLLHIYPFVGATPAAHAIEAKSLTDAKKITWNRGLADAAAHSSDGVYSNRNKPIRKSTSTEFGEVGLAPSSIYSSAYSVSYGAYLHTTEGSLLQDYKDMVIIGTKLNSMAPRYLLGVPSNSLTTCFAQIGSYVSIEHATANPVGFWAGSRTSATLLQLYKNGTSVGSNGEDTSALGLNTNHVTFFSADTNYNAHVGITSFLFLGNGLDSTQMSTLNTIVQAFETTLGRNV